MAISLCRRVYVDLSQAVGASLTLWQPGFKTTSDKETVLISGLSRLNFLSGSEDAPVYARTSLADATISNGDDAGVLEESGDYTGWYKFASLDCGLPVTVTPAEQ